MRLLPRNSRFALRCNIKRSLRPGSFEWGWSVPAVAQMIILPQSLSRRVAAAQEIHRMTMTTSFGL
jgi:hypothetical protein